MLRAFELLLSHGLIPRLTEDGSRQEHLAELELVVVTPLDLPVRLSHSFILAVVSSVVFQLFA